VISKNSYADSRASNEKVLTNIQEHGNAKNKNKLRTVQRGK